MEEHACNTSVETSFFILYSVIGTTIFIGNVLTCVVFLKTEKLRRNKMNVLLVSLAAWDILMSVFVVPFYAVYCGLGCQYSLTRYCWLMRGAKDCVTIATTLNLYAITYDRYTAVLQPLQYNSKVTSERVAATLAVVWLLPVFLAGVRNFWQHSGSETRFANKLYDSVIVLGFVVSLVILMLITNANIIGAIRKQASRERDSQRGAGVTAVSNQKRKGTTACVAVVLVFVLCWLPRAVYNFSFIINPPGLTSPLFFKICFLFLFLQSSLNPFIYWFYRDEFRQATFSLLNTAVSSKVPSRKYRPHELFPSVPKPIKCSPVRKRGLFPKMSRIRIRTNPNPAENLADVIHKMLPHTKPTSKNAVMLFSNSRF